MWLFGGADFVGEVRGRWQVEYERASWLQEFKRADESAKKKSLGLSRSEVSKGSESQL